VLLWRCLQIGLVVSTAGAVVRGSAGPDNLTSLLIGDGLALACYPLLFLSCSS
jgi:hypothetical protein